MSAARNLLVVLGNGAIAESLTRYLCSTGARVAHIGSAGCRERVAAKLWEDVEEDFPFMFLDDIKNQEDLHASRLARVEFRPSFDGVDPHSVSVVFEAGAPPPTVYETAREALPDAPIVSAVDEQSEFPKSLDPNTVALRFFHPLNYTRIAEVIAPSQDSAIFSRVKEILSSLSIRVLSAQEGQKMTKLITDWRGLAQSQSGGGVHGEDERSPESVNRLLADLTARLFDEYRPNEQHANFMH